MNILWVKMGGLWPQTSGGRTRSLQIIDELSRRHAVTIVTTHSDGDDPAGLVAWRAGDDGAGGKSGKSGDEEAASDDDAGADVGATGNGGNGNGKSSGRGAASGDSSGSNDRGNGPG